MVSANFVSNSQCNESAILPSTPSRDSIGRTVCNVRRSGRSNILTYKLTCLIAFLALTITYARPQALYNESSENLGHQSWSTENGLPQNSVHQIFQANDGYLWIATEAGVARFNSIGFKVFAKQSDTAFTTEDVCCFTQNRNDPIAALWIGTSDGLLQYSAQKFRRFSMADGLPSAVIVDLATDDTGATVALTQDGLARFDGARFTPINLPSAAPATAITVGFDGSIWIIAANKLFRYQHRQLTALTMPPGGSKDTIEAIHVEADSSLWLSTRTTLTELNRGSVRVWTTGRELPGTRIAAVFHDTRGTLWIGTNKGLVSLDPMGVAHLQQEVGTNSVLSIFEDREGDLWIGTEATGLHVLRQQKFHTLPQFSDRVVTAIAQTRDGAMWIGTNGDGLDRWQNGTTKHLSAHSGLLSDVILALAPAADNSLWVGTPDGLNHITSSKIETFTSADGLPDDLIRSLLVDDDGTVWIGTRRGLAHYKDRIVTTISHAEGLKSDLVGALLRTRDPAHPSDAANLWIATLNGLSRLHDGHITTFSTHDGLSGEVITSLLQDSSGTLWVGTNGHGLNYLNPSGFLAVHNLSLPATIQSILQDDHGSLWLTSGQGITRVSAAELKACAGSATCTARINTYGSSDGMPTSETSAIGHPSAWKSSHGTLWFATRKGIAITTPAHLQEDNTPPPVAIERFTVDDLDRRVVGSELTVGPGHTRYAFDYIALSFAAPSKVLYRYTLEGFDKQWIQAGNRRSAYYTNLPPRTYRFRVQAANQDGVWNDSAASLTFVVKPPFYRRLWFILASLVLLALIWVLLYRLRVQRIKSQFDAVLAERTRIAREIHDTLAQDFVGVSVQLELASQLLIHADAAAAQQQLDRTREYVRRGLEAARRSIWELRASNAQDTLPTRLSRLADQVCQSSGDKLHITVDIGGTYRPLALALESEVLRIAQEALANVLRHAAARNAAIVLRYQPTRLLLTITDDGQGFRAADETFVSRGHFGLHGMRERAAQINAHLTFDSIVGEGTTATLDVPISPAKGSKP